MRRFTRLFTELDESNKTTVKLAALEQYFREAPARDAAWALFFLTGNRFRSPVKTALLRKWAAEASELPGWLIEESYSTVGDLGETLALILPEGENGALVGEGTRETAERAEREEAKECLVQGDLFEDTSEAGNATQELRTPTGRKQVAGSTDLAEISFHRLIEDYVKPLGGMTEPAKKRLLLDAWAHLKAQERFVFNKLITGGFRVGVQRTLVVRALAQVAGCEPAVMAHRLMGRFDGSVDAYRALMSADDNEGEDPAKPYPFYLAYPIEEREEQNLQAALGDLAGWQVEWKWDGIRAQLIKRQDRVILWSRGEELIAERFPEPVAAAEALPNGTVLDGEILCWRDGKPLPFGSLQTRIGRKTVSQKVQREAPAAFIAYDCLENDGQDIREAPIERRRDIMEGLLAQGPAPANFESEPVIIPSPIIATIFESKEQATGARSGSVYSPPAFSEERVSSWGELDELRKQSRERRVEGFMLKRRQSPYRVGRIKGDWWKWKTEPYLIDAVMVYAQAGHGKRAGLFTDYSFAVWDGDQLVPFAKAYSGLTDKEISRLDRWIKQHTKERHGPVRIVEPVQVFELAFEGINRSSRHKSGFAVRFPRINRWREDKPASQADTVETIRALIPEE